MASSKICFKCGKRKALEKFYRHHQMLDGRLNKCIECAKADAAAHRSANIEKVREYDRERAKQPHRIKQAAEVARAWRQEDKRRARAHSAVARAVRSGQLERLPCSVCGDPKSHAHHEDYDRKLDVTWLCASHHKHHHQAQ